MWWSSHEQVQGDEKSISIGRPIANTQFYILDAALRPTPIGVAGELYIGGDGVVRGYHQRAELTAERFVPNPFRSSDAAKMYRTGDLASYRADGSVEFLGRLDQQVKFNGYRIELGEIESALAQHPHVDEAVVVAWGDDNAEQRLIGYYVAKQGVSLDEKQLKSQLREQLPEYMVPSRLMASVVIAASCPSNV